MRIKKSLCLLVAAITIALFSSRDKNQPSESDIISPYTSVGQIANIPSNGNYRGVGLAAADFNSDGSIDLAVTNVTASPGNEVLLYIHTK